MITSINIISIFITIIILSLLDYIFYNDIVEYLYFFVSSLMIMLTSCEFYQSLYYLFLTKAMECVHTAFRFSNTHIFFFCYSYLDNCHEYKTKITSLYSSLYHYHHHCHQSLNIHYLSQNRRTLNRSSVVNVISFVAKTIRSSCRIHDTCGKSKTRISKVLSRAAWVQGSDSNDNKGIKTKFFFFFTIRTTE